MSQTIIKEYRNILKYLEEKGLSITHPTLTVWRKKLSFPAVKVGKKLVSTEENIDKWIESALNGNIPEIINSKTRFKKYKKENNKKIKSGKPTGRKIEKRDPSENDLLILEKELSNYHDWLNKRSLKTLCRVGKDIMKRGFGPKDTAKFLKAAINATFYECRTKYITEGNLWREFNGRE